MIYSLVEFLLAKHIIPSYTSGCFPQNYSKSGELTAR